MGPVATRYETCDVGGGSRRQQATADRELTPHPEDRRICVRQSAGPIRERGPDCETPPVGGVVIACDLPTRALTGAGRSPCDYITEMPDRVPVRSEMLRWARERAGLDAHEMARRLPGLPEWERGDKQPTLKQLEAFAKVTHVPFGYLFLPAPPEERMPIRDYRTIQGEVRRPSPDLLDTIQAMQRRSAWLREDRIECEAAPVDVVGSARLTDDPEAVGREMRRIVGIGDGWAAGMRTWMDGQCSDGRTQTRRPG